MPDTPTTILSLTKPEVGGSTNTWGAKTNTNWDSVDAVVAGVTQINVTAGVVVLSASQQLARIIKCVAPLVGNLVLQFSRSGEWVVWNETSGDFTVTVQFSGQPSPPTVRQGTRSTVVCDGTTVRTIASGGVQETIFSAYSDMFTRGAGASNGATLYSLFGSDGVQFQGWEFSQSVSNFVQCYWLPPKRWDLGSVSYQFYWTNASNTAPLGEVRWGVRSRAVSDGQYFGSDLTANGLEVNDAFISNRYLHVSPLTSAQIIANTPVVGDAVIFEFYREGSHATDTLNSTVVLFAVKMRWTATKFDDE